MMVSMEYANLGYILGLGSGIMLGMVIMYHLVKRNMTNLEMKKVKP